MKTNGLGEFIPRRVKWKNSKAKSLSAQINRCMSNWHVNTDEMSWQEERMMIAMMVKIAVLALMDSTCYSFGGKLFKQMKGAGIGLRASACMAKLVMGLIDRMWADIQKSWDVIIYIYFRYIDDLRIFLHPITKGWFWDKGWKYDRHSTDVSTPAERTIREISKSLNAVTNFIQFTAEGEGDFDNNFLPTLDFQTQVQSSGKIMFKFFSKPMANNITIQHGTGLSKSTVFSALRQEVIRRMLNTSIEIDFDERLRIVEDFIQLMINSGHRYKFIKSVILQAITKYKFMVGRSRLPEDKEKFKPLYRARCFDQLRRDIAKRVEGSTWYKGIEVHDKFRNEWKSDVKYCRERPIGREKETEKKVICAMFIPPSENSRGRGN